MFGLGVLRRCIIELALYAVQSTFEVIMTLTKLLAVIQELYLPLGVHCRY